MNSTLILTIAAMAVGGASWVVFRPQVPGWLLKPLVATMLACMVGPAFIDLGNAKDFAKSIWSPLFCGGLIGEYLFLKMEAAKQARAIKAKEAKALKRRTKTAEPKPPTESP